MSVTTTSTGFLTPDIIAKEAAMVLRNNAVLAGLVNRDYSGEFAGKVGTKITVRKPSKFSAVDFKETGAITVQNVNETGVEVEMAHLLDTSIKVTTEDLSLSIEDFSAQILTPAMQSFLDQVDKYIIAAAEEAGTAVTLDTTDYKGSFVEGRKVLQKAGAPLTDRNFVCGVDVEAGLLKTDLLVSANTRADNGAAINDARLGTIYGIDTYCDQNVSDAEAIAFHKNGIIFVTRTPELPLGASRAAVANYDGFGIRVVQEYDITTKSDMISLDFYCGVAIADASVIAILK